MSSFLRSPLLLALTLTAAAGCAGDAAETESNSDKQDVLDTHEPNDGFATAAIVAPLHEQQPIVSFLEISAAPGDVVGDRPEDWFALPYSAAEVPVGVTEVVAHSVRIRAQATPGAQICAFYEGTNTVAPLMCLGGTASYDQASSLHGCCTTEWRDMADSDLSELVVIPTYAERAGQPNLQRILVSLSWASTEHALSPLGYKLLFDEVR